MNNVNVTGRLTRKPELETKPGIQIAILRVAIPRRGAKGAVFTDVKTFGKQAAACVEHLDKGRLVAIEGRLELDQWESKGQKRSRLYIVGERVEFIDKPTDEPAEAAAEEPAAEVEPEAVAQAA